MARAYATAHNGTQLLAHISTGAPCDDWDMKKGAIPSTVVVMIIYEAILFGWFQLVGWRCLFPGFAVLPFQLLAEIVKRLPAPKYEDLQLSMLVLPGTLLLILIFHVLPAIGIYKFMVWLPEMPGLTRRGSKRRHS